MKAFQIACLFTVLFASLPEYVEAGWIHNKGPAALRIGGVVSFDLQDTYDISQVKFLAGHNDGETISGKLEYSKDGLAWSQWGIVSNATYDQIISFTSVTASKVRFTMTGGGGRDGMISFSNFGSGGLAIFCSTDNAGIPNETASNAKTPNPRVTVNTNMGSFFIELFEKEAPLSVENFLKYVDAKFYDKTIFHRVIPGFVIQGGGFDKKMVTKAASSPIRNEASNGLKNLKGTLSMARSNDIDDATSQFFVNLKDNATLDYVSNAQYGYAVFGKVVQGFDVIEKIAAVKTLTKGKYQNVPATPVLIETMLRLDEPSRRIQPSAIAQRQTPKKNETIAKNALISHTNRALIDSCRIKVSADGTPTEYRTFEASYAINGILWARDGNIYFASDKSVGIYCPAALSSSSFIAKHNDIIRALAMSDDGGTMASIAWDGIFQEWQTTGLSRGAVKQTRQLPFSYPNSIAFGPGAQCYAVGDNQGKAALFDASGNVKWNIKAGDKVINALVFSEDGQSLISGGNDGAVRIFGVVNGDKIGEKSAHENGITRIVFLPSGRELLIAGKDGKITRWSFPALQKLAEHKLDASAVNDMAITGDGRFVITGNSSGKVFVLDLKDDRVVGTRNLGDDSRVNAVALSPDERFVAYGGSDKAVHIASLFEFEAFAAAYSAPCDLMTTISFSDSGSFEANNMLEGAESESYVTTTTTNKGQGSAYGVIVRLSCDNRDVNLIKAEEPMGLMLPGATIIRQWPITVSAEARSGIAQFLVETKEAEKRDAPKLVLPVRVRALDRPTFEISGEEWNDGKLGMASGNNNGVIENGETIELIVRIRNAGIGRAREVRAHMSFASCEGLSVITDSVELGDIAPEETEKATFIFSVSKEFSLNRIIYGITVEDSRGVAKFCSPNRAVLAKVNLPILDVDIGKPASVSNGSSFAFTVRARNRGKLAATDVKMQLTSSAQNVRILEGVQRYGTIEPAQSCEERRITVEVPRRFNEPSINFNLKLDQSLEFKGIDTTFAIAVERLEPKLVVDATLLGGNSNSTVRQGQQATLRVVVENQGSLPASGVDMILIANRAAVKLGLVKERIGAIPAHTSGSPQLITLDVPRGESSGLMRIDIKLTQEDFSPVTRTLTYEIIEATSILAEMPESQDLSKDTRDVNISVGSNLQAQNGIKLLVLPRNDSLEVTEPRVILRQLSVTSTIGINSLSILVNGVKHLDQTDPQVQALLKESSNTFVALSNIELPLMVGRNIIIIKAIESLSNTENRRELIATYTPPHSVLAWKDESSHKTYSTDVDADIETIAKTKKSLNRCAIVIGIEKYQYAEPAKYARHDAEVFAAYARDVFGVPDDQIFTFFDWEADTWRLSRMFSDDSKVTKFLNDTANQAEVYFYFSGHGVPNFTESQDAQASLILPSNVRPQMAEAKAGGMPIATIIQNLKDRNPKFLFIAIDACFSGRDKKGNALAADRPAFIREPIRLSGSNEVSFYASSSDETANLYDEKYHGLFTYYFLKGLRGEADVQGDNNNKVTIKELKDYLSRNVPKEASKFGAAQNPQVTSGDMNRVLVELNR